mmetsp:Transcript_65154/g.187520  ORF Transcript_65154/g.187520 Transcript_65154/m.187520 type:complete len:262 (-) Transcript_65154:40-825(-)
MRRDAPHHGGRVMICDDEPRGEDSEQARLFRLIATSVSGRLICRRTNQSRHRRSRCLRPDLGAPAFILDEQRVRGKGCGREKNGRRRELRRRHRNLLLLRIALGIRRVIIRSELQQRWRRRSACQGAGAALREVDLDAQRPEGGADQPAGGDATREAPIAHEGLPSCASAGLANDELELLPGRQQRESVGGPLREPLRVRLESYRAAEVPTAQRPTTPGTTQLFAHACAIAPHLHAASSTGIAARRHATLISAGPARAEGL